MARQELTVVDRIFGNARRVFSIPSFEEFHLAGSAQRFEITHVYMQLLHGSASKGVARGDQHTKVVLEKPKANL